MSRLTRVIPPGVEHGQVRLADAVAASRSLTARDHTVIRLLGEHQVLTVEQLTRVVFPNEHRARHRLLELTRRGVLARFRHCRRPGSVPWRYTLGLLGAAIHAAQTGAVLPRPAALTEKIIRLQYSPRLEHRLGVNEFFTRLAGHARTHPDTALGVWWSEAAVGAACGGIVRPDGYGEWTEPDPAGAAVTVGFFLEYDTGTEPLATLLRKIDQYGQLSRAGITRPVLLHLPTTTRARHLHAEMARAYGHAGPPAPVATTAADHTSPARHPSSAEPVSPAGRVWLPAGGERRLRLIELAALTSGRSAARDVTGGVPAGDPSPAPGGTAWGEYTA